MKKINVLTGIGLTTLLLATSNQLLAKDVNILCDACSVKEMEVKAKQKLANSLPSEMK
ncbi:hypothetical protein KO495_02290 [Colwellia sp. D2M02]|uniref:hypothetical protein n=1 Tax=Colwellia sp. D2M02 TaxID=2841562 RepID=UPI001C098C77|nr:hypothetical protein [Colwellia sp. D2M02]MBU2892152.1 hypothetical protein [Colwellia sp. D2M02]